MDDRDLLVLAARFAETPEFATSPLYRSLAKTVAANPRLLRLAARGRPGQYPTFPFFGFVHALLLAGVDHALARYFPSGGRKCPPTRRCGESRQSPISAPRSSQSLPR
jgi:hypothetical protein